MENAGLAPTQFSALWAAYGDAIGFITELATSPSEVERRCGSQIVEGAVSWKRRVGGRSGPIIQLPAGAYSDDTQLRLAVSRSIRRNGTFDVETFSKVELPVWQSYALGAGLGSKAAAGYLASPGVTWSTNLFDTKRSRYVAGGGNGAAMRVQPHVWSSPQGSRIGHAAPDVLRDAITTHGHPRGIGGALFYAWLLGVAIDVGQIPDPASWSGGFELVRGVHDLIRRDDELSVIWRPTWEDQIQTTVEGAFREVADELKDLASSAALSLRQGWDGYGAFLAQVGGLDKATRGSGTIAAVAAGLLALNMVNDPRALERSVNILQSDTDTIASMGGAVFGAVCGEAPPHDVQDQGYLLADAGRLSAISAGGASRDFPYPDLLGWKPPRTQADGVGAFADAPVVLGLGPATAINDPILGVGKDAQRFAWQWLRLWFGQTVLAKSRVPAPSVDQSQFAEEDRSSGREQQSLFTSPPGIEPSQRQEASRVRANRPSQAPDLGIAVDLARDRGYSPSVVGTLVRQYAEAGEVDSAIAFAAFVAGEIAAGGTSEVLVARPLLVLRQELSSLERRWDERRNESRAALPRVKLHGLDAAAPYLPTLSNEAAEAIYRLADQVEAVNQIVDMQNESSRTPDQQWKAVDRRTRPLFRMVDEVLKLLP